MVPQDNLEVDIDLHIILDLEVIPEDISNHLKETILIQLRDLIKLRHQVLREVQAILLVVLLLQALFQVHIH